MSREVAAKAVKEAVGKGPEGFLWVNLIREVLKELGIDLGKKTKTVPEFVATGLRGFYPNRKDRWAEIQFHDAQVEHILTVMENSAKFGLENCPEDPPKPEPKAAAEGGAEGAAPKPKKAKAPPAPPKAPAPPAPAAAGATA